MIYAGTHHPSFEQASQALRHLADLLIPTKQVERLTQRIGTERCAERDAAVAAYQALPLVERKAAPAGVAAPDVAVVQVDGGRLQILDRGATAAAVAATAAANQPASHWREDKVGLLASMTSAVSAADPCATIPEHFVDPLRILKLAREIKGSTGVSEDAAPTPTPDLDAAAVAVYSAPDLEQRSMLVPNPSTALPRCS